MLAILGSTYLSEKQFMCFISTKPDDYSPQEKRLTLLVLLLLEHEIENETVRNFFNIDMVKASNLLKELVSEEMVYRKTKSMKFAKYALSEKYLRKIGS